MTDYSGSWAKGFASTFAQAPSMMMNALEWKERKKAQKKIDDAIEELKFNSTELARKYDTARADGTITQQEYSDTVSWAMPLGNEILSRVEKLYGDYRGLTSEQIDAELEDIKAFYNLSKDVDFQNIEQMRAFGSRLTQPKAKIQWNSIIKSIESRQAQPTVETFPTAGGVTEAYPGAGVKYTEKGYVPTIAEKTEAKGATMADEKSAITILRLFVSASPETFEAKKADLEKTRGLDLSAYTQDVLRESGSELANLYNTPSEVIANVKAPEGLTIVPSRDSKTGKYYATFQKKTTTPTPGGFRTTSLDTQEKWKQKALDTFTLEDKQKVVETYTEADYDPSEMPTDQEWIDSKLGELESHVQMLKEITDENGKLMGSKEFKFMSGDEAESQKGEAWYKDIYEAYMFYLEELRKMGIDVSKYPKIKSPGEIKKGFFGGYPSIYYTETTPTSIETPKLPLTP